MLFRLGLLVLLCGSSSLCAGEAFRVEVVDKENGWPVPMVLLRTTHNHSFVTDNAGVAAFDLPELMNRDVWLFVESHGYEHPADGFKYRGVRVSPKPGGSVTVRIERKIVAKRLGRLTGAGLFAESQKLGGFADWRESGVLGCDSVQMAAHGGKRFWIWGDTTLAHYPLGLFHASSATSDASKSIALKPPIRPTYDLFRDRQLRPRNVAEMPGKGPTWLSALVSVPDDSGTPRLVASFVKVEGFVDVYETGLCVWNETRSVFERERVLWTRGKGKRPPMPDGHAVLWQEKASATETNNTWILFGNPLPTLRFPARFESWKDPDTWEVLKPQKTLARAGGGKRVTPHSGSIAWNEDRQRWVTIFVEKYGSSSALGEVWYAEAPAPTGPWGTAVKVLSHNNYSFYNPRIHPDSSGSVLLFEGTFSSMFANKAVQLPRYDYNQILYRVDLDDPALKPAFADVPGSESDSVP